MVKSSLRKCLLTENRSALAFKADLNFFLMLFSILVPIDWSNSIAGKTISVSREAKAKRTLALSTGLTGINGGYGYLSSIYSIITLESYKTNSRSISVGRVAKGLRAIKSSGIFLPSKLSILVVIPFSERTKRTWWDRIHISVSYTHLTLPTT